MTTIYRLVFTINDTIPFSSAERQISVDSLLLNPSGKKDKLSVRPSLTRLLSQPAEWKNEQTTHSQEVVISSIGGQALHVFV